jgi:hypothetical protein
VAVDASRSGSDTRLPATSMRPLINRSARSARGRARASGGSDFTQGATVAIRWQGVEFRVKREAPLSSLTGHGTLGVAVHELDGTCLGRRCAFYRKTPPLD